MKLKQLQLSLPGLNPKTQKLAHGGESARGKRKERRPFDPKQALHVVLRSSKAHGEHSMLRRRHCNHLRDLVMRIAKRREVVIYHYANAGNHLHLLIRARSRANWQAFIREVAGGIAMLVTGARKGAALKRTRAANLPESASRAFWDHLVFTRIVAWGRDFKGVARYVCTNLWEGAGVPVRRYLERGFKILEINERSGMLVHSRASPEIIAALNAGG